MENLDAVLKKHKLTKDEYENILNILGREPNMLEIGIFSSMWSEHCSYKSSKKYLNGFPTKAPAYSCKLMISLTFLSIN